MFEILYVIKSAQLGDLFNCPDLLRNDPISVATLVSSHYFRLAVKKLNFRKGFVTEETSINATAGIV